MREGIHPNYYQATVTCNCGNTFVTGSAPSATHSIQVSRRLHRLVAVLISSTRNMVLNKSNRSEAEVESSQLLFLSGIRQKDPWDLFS